MIMGHDGGNVVLPDWMKPHTIEQAHKTVHDEMNALTSELHTTTNLITPDFLMSWNLKDNVSDVIETMAPCLLCLVHAGSQTAKVREKNKQKDTASMSPFAQAGFHLTNRENWCIRASMCSS